MSCADLTDLAVFVAVADHLSFRAAAEQLGVTPSALSHRMRQLEQRLGVRLLHRTTRSVAPTDAGRHLLEQLRPAIGQITGALASVRQGRDKPTGKLTMHVTTMAAEMAIAPVWRAFLARYPGVQLELGGYTEVVDIVAKGCDAGIAPREFIALDMTSVRITPPLKFAVVASPSYFMSNPLPKVPEDLRKHNCIQHRLPFTGALMNWTFTQDHKARSVVYKTDHMPTTGNLIISDMDLGLRAAVDGLGVLYTLEAKAENLIRAGHLVSVLEDWSPTFEGFYLYYPGNRQVPAALRALIEMLRITHGSKRPHEAESPFIRPKGLARVHTNI